MKHYAIKTTTVLSKPAVNNSQRKQVRGHLLSFMKLCSKSEIEGGRGVHCKVFANALRGSILKL